MTLENSYYGKGLTHTLVGCGQSRPFLLLLQFRMAHRSTHSYILLRDISKDYPRGCLLILNKDGSYRWHTHRMRYLLDEDNIRCDNDGEVAPLSEVECDLLDGIDSDADRYEVYNTPGKLEWGRSLKVGDTVLARLPGLSEHGSSDGEQQHQQHQYTTAIIRWCGKITIFFWNHYKFGVEIVVSSYVYIPSCIEIV